MTRAMPKEVADALKAKDVPQARPGDIGREKLWL